MDPKEQELRKIQDECNHKGHWQSAGQSQAISAKGMFLTTTMYCKRCGFMVYASQEIKLPNSKIAVPTDIRLKN